MYNCLLDYYTPRGHILRMEEKNKNRDYLIPFSVVIASLIIAIAWVYTAGLKSESKLVVNEKQANLPQAVDGSISDLEAEILPNEGIELPLKWGDFGKKLVESGAIDAVKFEEIYKARGGLNKETKILLYGVSNKNI